MTSRSALTSIRAHLAAHRATIAWGILFLAFSNLFGRSVLWVLKAGIDRLSQPTAWPLLFYAWFIVGLTALQGGFRFWGRWTLVGMARDIEFEIRNRLYAHLQSLAPSFYSRTPTGDLMSRATQDLNVIRQLFGAGIMYTVGTGITYLSTIPMMALIDPGLTLLTLLPFPFLLATLLRSQGVVHERFEEVQESFTQLTERAQENLSGIRLVKAYVMEEREADEFARINEEYVSRNLRLARVEGLFNSLSSVLSGIGMVVVLWLGGKRVIEGSMSLGGFVAFNGYLLTLIWPTIALAWIIAVIQRGLVSLERVHAILSEVPTIHESNHPVPVQSLSGEIEFRRLSFTHPGREQPVLKDVTLHIPAGSRIAIVGPTGAGKSSLVQCLPRLLEVPEGALFLDGVDITRIPLLTLRRSIGYVPQESFLFSDTLRENIAFGRPDAALEEVMAAAVTAGLGREIEEFPRGIETVVGERGITLSGGQRQRVTIARALMMNPAILVLDDSLSSVDAETEAGILDRLAPVMSQRTTLIITHRLTTIQGADLIVVLDDGQIVEVGKHEELLSNRGLYSELWHRQQLLSELESLAAPSPLTLPLPHRGRGEEVRGHHRGEDRR